MIKIKVCKLSEIVNSSILFLISGISIILLFQLTNKIIQPLAWDFVVVSIEKNLCLNAEKEFWEEMIYANFPVSMINTIDDIDKEVDLVGNLKDRDFQENTQAEDLRNTNLKDSENTLTSAYLLNCEKLSSSKYKIGDVTINDYTKKTLDFNELEKSLFTEVEEDCKVLIYHTHTSESYIGVASNTSQYRTENKQANVVRVGEELKNQLNQYGIFVRQDTSEHDYPSYNGAYKSSLKSVENILKNENYDIILDIHRDALASNSQYRPTAEINGETVAKLMFVVGTNAAGLKHDNWIENLKFAIAFQQRANELFPGLFRDLHLSTSRYNQHTSSKSLILEVGATGNTIEEACLAMKYFAKVLNAMRT